LTAKGFEEKEFEERKEFGVEEVFGKDFGGEFEEKREKVGFGELWAESLAYLASGVRSSSSSSTSFSSLG
jgi:hypothetical protein